MTSTLTESPVLIAQRPPGRKGGRNYFAIEMQGEGPAGQGRAGRRSEPKLVRAGDGLQLTLRFSFQPRLTRGRSALMARVAGNCLCNQII
jgi:hypothetical protein